MNEHTKEFYDKEEYREALLAFRDFQKRHNVLRKDYELLLKMTNECIDNSENFNALYRASLRGFFSLIESDIYGLNQIDNYENYKDNDKFEDKFKKTFKKICSTWNKTDIIHNYLSSKYEELKNIKNKRDKLVHPKETKDILITSKKEYEELNGAFIEYKKMLHSIMENFFISIYLNDLGEIKELIQKPKI